MAEKRSVKLSTDAARMRAIGLVRAAPAGYVVTIAEESRSQEQNRLMWPLIADIQAQVPEMRSFSADDIKLRFLHALGAELRFLAELEGAGMFPVGQRSSTLTKSQFTGLIDLLFAYGERHGVSWSHRSLNVREAA
ncbi:recombination protein NinB [Novosphingobium sp. HII-3]|uniref:recombination protein NinB n=1 Tax=Novosphingobium sp. HII-3 TaxID=2075565 RepID=UPI000CDAC8C1|nr:recombination protein NinB [Novosphingobium sp. HII-3]